MKLAGKKYSAEFGEHRETITAWKEGHYGKKSSYTRYFYEDQGFIEDLENREKYHFNFRTNNIENSNFKKKIINVEGIDFSKEEESKLVDMVLERILDKVKEDPILSLYFEGKEIKRRYLEERGIISEKDGQKRIVFD